MAKVTIIIPTYNVEMYLEECMESVVHQTLEDIEIICINDGSSDGSLQILKKYANRDKRIILVDKENGGYGMAMNIGLDRATGEYIGIVEPDDFVSVTMYEELFHVAAEHNLDLVKADFYRFKRDETGNMELAYNHLSDDSGEYNKLFNPSMTPEAMRFIMNTWSGIYKRSFLEKYHIRHNETPGASFQDNGFWFQTFIFAERAMILDRPYYMNRRDNPNSSVHNRDKVYCMNVEYDHIRDILMEYPELWERFKGMYWYKKYFNYMGTIDRIGEEYKEEYIKRFSAEFKRGIDKGEVDKALFSEISWAKIQMIVSNPQAYYQTRVMPPIRERRLQARVERLQKRNQQLSEELDCMKRSVSYRLGRILTFLPRKIRNIFSGR